MQDPLILFLLDPAQIKSLCLYSSAFKAEEWT